MILGNDEDGATNRRGSQDTYACDLSCECYWTRKGNVVLVAMMRLLLEEVKRSEGPPARDLIIVRWGGGW